MKNPEQYQKAKEALLALIEKLDSLDDPHFMFAMGDHDTVEYCVYSCTNWQLEHSNELAEKAANEIFLGLRSAN